MSLLGRLRDDDLSRTDDDLGLSVVARVVALLDDEREQHHADGSLLHLQLFVRGRLATAFVHQRRLEVDVPREVAVGVVLGLQRWEHDVFGQLGTHLHGQGDGESQHLPQRLEQLALDLRGSRQDAGQAVEDLHGNGVGVGLTLFGKRRSSGQQRQGRRPPAMHGVARPNLGQVLLQRLEFLSLVAVHAKQVPGEDELPHHGHHHGHKHIASTDPVP